MVETRARRGRGTGWIVFAGVVMILAGVCALALQGVEDLFDGVAHRAQ